MPNIENIIQNGIGNPWLLLPLAILLGAVHALEPGHPKSMMTAFIVAVQGTTRQAVLLGLAATVGHTIIVWALALLAWRIGDKSVLEKAEPWLLLVGGALLVWLAWRILSRLGPASRAHALAYGHDHSHAHEHDHETHRHDHGSLGHDAHAAYQEAEI